MYGLSRSGLVSQSRLWRSATERANWSWRGGDVVGEAWGYALYVLQ